MLRSITLLTLLWASLIQLVLPHGGLAQIQSRPAHSLRVVVAPYLAYGPYFVAQEEGFFAFRGVDVEFIRLKGSLQAIPLLIQGEVDVVAGILYPAYFNAMHLGANIRMVASRGTVSSSACPSYAYVARNELLSSGVLDDPQGLKGLRVATDGPSSSSTYLHDTLLASQGLTRSDITEIYIKGPNRLEAFASEAIDLTVIKEPFVTRFLDSGHVQLWKSVADLVDDYQDAVIIFGPSLLTGDPGRGKAFLTGYLEGVRQFNQGPTERNLDIMVKHTGLERNFLRRCCWPAIPNDGRINFESVFEVQDWFHRNGYTDAVIPLQGFWDSRFLDHALATLDEK